MPFKSMYKIDNVTIMGSISPNCDILHNEQLCCSFSSVVFTTSQLHLNCSICLATLHRQYFFLNKQGGGCTCVPLQSPHARTQ